MLFEVYRMFNGETTTCHGHTVRTLDGFFRVISRYQTGGAHGFNVVIPECYAKRLGITEYAGALYVGEVGRICCGEIVKP
jgi:hypothetical protein